MKDSLAGSWTSGWVPAPGVAFSFAGPAEARGGADRLIYYRARRGNQGTNAEVVRW